MQDNEASFDEMENGVEREPRSHAERAFGPRRVLMLYIAILVLLLISSLFLGRYTAVNSILISEWVFIFLPCAVYLLIFRVRITFELKITRVSSKSVAGIIFASLSGILLTGELVVLQNQFVRIPPEYLEMLREQFAIPESVGFHRAALAFAVSPAICEELLFRGIVLQSLLRKFTAPGAIILAGLLFGLFHLDPYRLMGTTILGIIMGFIMVRAMSLLAPMLYHMVNNLIVLLVMNTEQFQEIPWLMEEAHLPPLLLFLAAIVFFTSMKMIGPVYAGKTIQAAAGSNGKGNI